MSAISNSLLYSKDHASVNELTNKAFSILENIFKTSESLEIMVIEDDFVLNKKPVREIGLQTKNLIKRLKRKGISRIDLLKGITISELKQLVAELSTTEKSLKSYPHIKTGVIDVKVGDVKKDIDLDSDGLSKFTSEQIDQLKEVYYDLTPFKKLNIAGLEEIVVNFLLTFRKEVSILKLISPVKTYSEYTYTHATNVAVLSMFQAETLGMRDDILRDIGIAGLLHDVGKLFISKETLEKTGALDDKEWEEIKLHPLFGAQYLAKMDNLTRLASIAAFEHHCRYDGQGYPHLDMTNRKQHLCSQIVAISDFYDALRSRRSYRRSLEINEVLTIMKSDSEGAFNPLLLDNFIRGIHVALSK
jgi:HD-GYP domain-containing protein (c-di-GMP phosphodiesterase class II)